MYIIMMQRNLRRSLASSIEGANQGMLTGTRVRQMQERRSKTQKRGQQKTGKAQPKHECPEEGKR